MIFGKSQVFRPAAVRQARRESSRLSVENPNLWEDIREVLLDPDPNPWELEVVRRWLRDEVERELLRRLSRSKSSHFVRQACRLAPGLIWTLPFSGGQPPKKYHRRIVAILLPHKLRQVEQQLAIYAFHEGLQSGGR